MRIRIQEKSARVKLNSSCSLQGLPLEQVTPRVVLGVSYSGKLDKMRACGTISHMTVVTSWWQQRKKLILNILAIAGLVILIAILVLGLFRIATLSKPWFNSLFSFNVNPIQTAIPSIFKGKPPSSDVSTAALPAAEQPSTISNTATPKAADLSVRILSLGVIDRISGDIIPRSPMSPDDLVAVRFLISNSGNVPTGPWYFGALLPTTAPNSAYASPVQASLAPGDSIENMLRFTYAVPAGLFTVYVDQYNQVSESNESNNTASVSI